MKQDILDKNLLQSFLEWYESEYGRKIDKDLIPLYALKCYKAGYKKGLEDGKVRK